MTFRKVTRRVFTGLTAGTVVMVAHKSFAQSPADPPAALLQPLGLAKHRLNATTMRLLSSHPGRSRRSIARWGKTS